MRLGIIGDEISQDLDTVLDVMAREGFTGLEVRSVWDVPPHELSDEQADRIVGRCAARGIEVIGFDAPVGKCALITDEQRLAEERRTLRRCLDLAQRLGAGFIRCFAFYREGDPDPARAAEAFGALVEGIDTGGVDLLVETGMRTHVPTVPLALDLLGRLDRPDIGILWDPGNSAYSGVEPEPFPRDWEAGRDLIRHVHVKNPRGSEEYVTLARGDLDWSAIVRRLGEDGYPGWLSLETHWRHDRILSQTERDTPWGSSFSDAGEASSGVLMGELREIAASLGA